MVYLPAAILGRPAKTTSWVLRKALAISTEEPTTTECEPKRSIISGPYFFEREWRERWGSGPMRLRLPIMGHGFGPGGRLSLRRRKRRERRMRARVRSHVKM